MGEVMKLSTAQRSAMLALDCAGDWMSAYTLRHGLHTLDALEKKGLAKSKSGLGAIVSPRTVVKYRLTDAGRAWCKTNFTDVLNVMINEAEK